MTSNLEYIAHNAHDVIVDDKRILFHIPTSSLFNLDDVSGDMLDLCHRFTGSDIDTYGHVDTGIKKKELGAFLESRADRDGTWCDTCRIRNLCSGGCYHESYAIIRAFLNSM